MPEYMPVSNVYKIMKRSGDGADGGVIGLNGSVTASSLVKILRLIHARDHVLVDLGAGDGRVILSAMAVGSDKAVGFELPLNNSYKILFLAARRKLQQNSGGIPFVQVQVDWSRAEWTPRDVDTLETLECNPYCIFSFWVGMPLNTQQHILYLCNSCTSVKEIAVFRDRKWTKPQQGLENIACLICNQFPKIVLRFKSMEVCL